MLNRGPPGPKLHPLSERRWRRRKPPSRGQPSSKPLLWKEGQGKNHHHIPPDRRREFRALNTATGDLLPRGRLLVLSEEDCEQSYQCIVAASRNHNGYPRTDPKAKLRLENFMEEFIGQTRLFAGSLASLAGLSVVWQHQSRLLASWGCYLSSAESKKRAGRFALSEPQGK
jgi:hypothetical protein